MRQYTWTVSTRGRYQVEITRLTAENLKNDISDRAVLAAVQSIRPEYPLNIATPLALIAVRIRATYQLNGALDNINALVEREGLVRVDDAWVPGYGRTPATAFLWALMGPANPYPVAEAEIDMDLIADWHDWCVEKGLKYDRVHDESESLAEMLVLICAAGRATPRHDGIKWGVVIDRPQELVIDHINPRNSNEFAWSRSYFTPPDAMRVRFLDETNDFQEAERIVPWPGHAGSIDLTEELQLPGKTDPDEIWREARRRMYEMIHRPDQFTALQDGASRVATRGDLVMGSFDVLERAAAAARVTSVIGNMFEIDELIDIAEGYAARFTVYADDDDVIGSSLVRPLVPAGLTSTLHFATSGPMPTAGEIIHVGPSQTESLALRLRGIEPGENLTARLLMVAAAPIIDDLTDADVPPVWDGRVGDDAGAPTALPAAPRFTLVSVGTVEGGGANTVQVLVQEGAGSAAQVTSFQIDHRLDGASIWTSLTVPAGASGVTISSYALTATIELRARAFAGAIAGPFNPVTTFVLASGVVTVPPNVPGGAVTVSNLGGAARISIASGTNAAIVAFHIYRVPSGGQMDRAVHGTGGPRASTPSTTVVYDDVVAAGAYGYYVEALDSDGNAGDLAGPFNVTVT
jgi:hypothetical protein